MNRISASESVATTWSAGESSPTLERAEACGPERRAEREEDRDLRHAAPLHQPGEQRGDQDHHAHQRERVRELGGSHVRLRVARPW